MYITLRLSGFALCGRARVAPDYPQLEGALSRGSLRMWTSELEVSESRAKPVMIEFLEGIYLLSALSCFVFIAQRVSAV